MAVRTHHRVLLALAVVVVLAGLVPLLRANAAAREQAWLERCTAQGGTVSTKPADTSNPLVVTTGHPVLRCYSASGVFLSERD